MTQTHFGFETVDEREKARRVRAVFDSVAPRYDLMNDLMSVGLHRWWKAYAVMVAAPQPGQRVLDIAGGTGDLGLALAPKVQPGGVVVHTDITRPCFARAVTGCSTAAGRCPPWCATPSGCRFPTAPSTSSRWPSACAT